MSAAPAWLPEIVPALRIGGLTPLTTTDYPGLLAAVLFCQGCPWRCGYCHNPHLIPPRGGEEVSWQQVREFLLRRRGLLDAVVFSGGEPTLQAGLEEACREVREKGFKVGLHSAGPYPERFERILPLVDWVGFDVKAPFESYEATTRVPGSGERVRESLRLLLDSGVDYEVRTTVHADLLDMDGVLRLAEWLAEAGVRRYVIQAFRPGACLDPELSGTPLGRLPWDELEKELRSLFQDFSIRRP